MYCFRKSQWKYLNRLTPNWKGMFWIGWLKMQIVQTTQNSSVMSQRALQGDGRSLRKLKYQHSKQLTSGGERHARHTNTQYTNMSPVAKLAKEATNVRTPCVIEIYFALTNLLRTFEA